MNTNEKIQYETESFLKHLIPFGSGDIRAAIETALKAGKNGDWAGEQINNYIEETGSKLEDIDPNYVIYDALLQEARNDIEQLTGKDILNDTHSQIEVYANYMCTSFYYTEEAKEELKEILKDVNKEDYTDVINWLLSELE